MPVKQSIAIIGATGNMGAALAWRLAFAPYRLLLISRNMAKLAALKETILDQQPGAEIATSTCAVDMSWEADIIILAVPFEAERNLAEKIKTVTTRKIVVSISNPGLSDDDTGKKMQDTSAAEVIQATLPDASVVKAFNTILPSSLMEKCDTDKLVEVFIAGDNNEAVESIGALVKSAGLLPIISGSLQTSRNLESMAFKLIT